MNVKMIACCGIMIMSMMTAKAQNVGLGTVSPNGRLQFKNEIFNRMLVLNQSVNNDHNFFGFGINEFTLRYQVADPNQSHVFFAGSSANASASNELFRIRGNGHVGIGQPNPNAPLQFANDLRNRKIVLFEGAPNDHQFYGLGVNSGLLRYHVDAANAAHVFFAAIGSNTSNELMRIQGNGNVGIGFNNPQRPLSFPPTLGKKISLYPGMVGDAGFSVWGNELRMHSDNPNAAITFGVDAYNAPQFSERMRITGAGNVGIGNSNPTAPLQFATDTRNRKIVMWSVADNDHQFYGLGVNAFTQRYQVPGTTDDHVFFAGNGANASNELFRIKGNGALAVAGNTGMNGEVLTSRGAGLAPAWQGVGSQIPFLSGGQQIRMDGTDKNFSNINLSFTTARQTRVLLWFSAYLTGLGTCLVGPCPMAGRVSPVLNGSAPTFFGFTAAQFPVGGTNDVRTFGPVEYILEAGSYNITFRGISSLGQFDLLITASAILLPL